MCGLRVIYVLSVFLQVFETSPCRGGSAEIFFLKNKESLPRAYLYGSRQRPPLPRASLVGSRQRFFFFKKKSLPSACPVWLSAKTPFAESQPDGLSAKTFFLKKINSLCREPASTALGKDDVNIDIPRQRRGFC